MVEVMCLSSDSNGGGSGESAGLQSPRYLEIVIGLHTGEVHRLPWQSRKRRRTKHQGRFKICSKAGLPFHVQVAEVDLHLCTQKLHDGVPGGTLGELLGHTSGHLVELRLDRAKVQHGDLIPLRGERGQRCGHFRGEVVGLDVTEEISKKGFAKRANNRTPKYNICQVADGARGCQYGFHITWGKDGVKDGFIVLQKRPNGKTPYVPCQLHTCILVFLKFEDEGR